MATRNEAARALPLELESLDKAKAELVKLKLDALPADRALVGPPPSREFVQSIREHGVIEPITVVQAGEAYVVRAGRRRIKAARQAGLQTIRAVVYSNVGTVEALTIASVENAQRAANPKSDLEVIQELRQQGKSLRLSGLPQAKIDRWLRLSGLETPFLRAIDEGKLTVAAAEGILKLSAERRADLLKQLAEGQRIPAGLVADLKRVQVAQRARAVTDVLNGVAEASVAPAPEALYVVVDIQTHEITGGPFPQSQVDKLDRAWWQTGERQLFRLVEA